MTNYERGRKAEYKAVEELRRRGFQAFRTAGSKGPFDVVAFSEKEIVVVQVKRGKKKRATKDARELLASLPCPSNVRKEVWTWVDRQGFVRKEVVS